MTRTLLPAAGYIVCQHGTHVLLLKRSERVDSWPNYWGFPGGKLEDGELFRECALRETSEEIGIVTSPEAFEKEALVMTRTVQGTKLIYFGLVTQFDNAPENLEPRLATDMAWFPIAELPEPMIPHHKI
jgi:8-oxo-dGTP pyrophosphatase MutT (NUDIX family)